MVSLLTHTLPVSDHVNKFHYIPSCVKVCQYLIRSISHKSNRCHQVAGLVQKVQRRSLSLCSCSLCMAELQ